jgi:hypothetical protein
MRHFALLLLVCLAGLAALASCGGTAPNQQPTASHGISIAAYPGSSWSAADLAVRQEADGSLSLASTSGRPAASVLLELRLPADEQAVVEQWTPPQGALSLVVADRPGLLALGIVMPTGQTLPPGQLIRWRLQAAGPLARAAAGAPQNKYGQVDDLVAIDEAGNVRLDWSYRNDGDCDQNSEVNISDLTALALRLHHVTNDGTEDNEDGVVDVDGNGEVNASDLTGIGINFHGTVTAYKVFQADGQDLATAASTELATVDFPMGTENPKLRRTFTATIPAAQAGAGLHWYYVKPVEVASGNTGPASNVVSFDLTPQIKFEVPPTGLQTPDAGACLSPSLVLMPAINGVSADGAPVIAYLNGTTLSLAHYNSGAWVTEDISGGAVYTAPQALFTGTAGLVFAFDAAAQQLVVLRFDSSWTSTGAPEVVSATGLAAVPSIDADYDAGTDTLGVALGYATAQGQRIAYCQKTGAAAWTSTDVYTGSGTATEILGGLSFRFDPQGGQPWCVYSVGTTNIDLANITFDINTTLSLGRFDGTQWAVSPVAYPDNPLALDLGFDAAGNARLGMNAARDWVLNIPLVGTYTLTLQLDGTVGDYNGTTFVFPATPVYESSAAFGLIGQLPPTGFSLTLALATSASLAGPAGFCVGTNDGELDFDLNFNPTGGNLAAGTAFYTYSGTAWQSSAVFTGGAGRNFSWRSGGAGMSAAYLQGVNLDSTNLGQAGTVVASPLEYWSP